MGLVRVFTDLVVLFPTASPPRMRRLARAVPMWTSRSLRRVLLMAAALAVAPPRPAAAQETGGPSYAQRHWTAEDGLPVNSVRDLAQGPQGYLWAATYAGLVRFDGRARAHR